MLINSNNVQLFKKLNQKRIGNFWQLLSSYYYSKYRKKVYHRGFPFAISFEPTTTCNLKCPQCPSGLRQFSRPVGAMQLAFFQKVIHELADTLCYLNLYFQGEPYLHPQFLDAVHFANQHNIYTVTSTNAHYLNETNSLKTVQSGLDKLIISLDGTTQETYEKYRIGGKLYKVLQGIRTLVNTKKELKSKTPYILLQFIVFKHNEHQLQDIKHLARQLGADELAIKTAQIYDYEKDTSFIPLNSQYARYHQNKHGQFQIKNKLLNQCWRMWHSCVITWDGKVVPCCFDKDAKHSFGSLQNSSFRDIWTGEKYHYFRSQLLHHRSQIDICKNCSEGTQVWA